MSVASASARPSTLSLLPCGVRPRDVQSLAAFRYCQGSGSGKGQAVARVRQWQGPGGSKGQAVAKARR
eukprot:359731-Chlamydomonas_euryale.AAC.1